MSGLRQRIILRHGSDDEINSSGDILSDGEPCIVELDDGKRKILYGDGITPVADLNKKTTSELNELKLAIESTNKSIEIQNKKYKKKVWNASAMRKRRY